MHGPMYLLERGEGAVGRVHVLLVHLIGEQQQVPVHTEANHVLLVLQGENLSQPTGGKQEGGQMQKANMACKVNVLWR